MYHVQLRETDDADCLFLRASAIFFCKHTWALSSHPSNMSLTMISHISDDTENSIRDTAKWLPDVPPTSYDS